MEHNHAVASNAVERYLLAEMSPEERDDFEDHYFSCMSCADDMRTASRFRDAARLQLGADREAARLAAASKKESPRRWWTFPQLVPAGFAAALAGVVIYLGGFQIPQLQRALATASLHTSASMQMVGDPVTLHETTRGEVPHIPRGGGDSFSVFFDIPSAIPGSTYDCRITNAEGKLADRMAEFKPKPDGTATVSLPRINFPQGSYTITIQKGNILVSQFNFIVE